MKLLEKKRDPLFVFFFLVISMKLVEKKPLEAGPAAGDRGLCFCFNLIY